MTKKFLAGISQQEITVQTPNGTARGRVSQRPDRYWQSCFNPASGKYEAPKDWDGDRSGE